MIKKFIIGVTIFSLLVLPLSPIGTPAGTKIYNGSDNGVLGETDVDGDTILFYTTEFSSFTTCDITEIVVSSGYAIAPLTEIQSPVYALIGEKTYISYKVCNLANTEDQFVFEVSTGLPQGCSISIIDDVNQDKVRQENETQILQMINIQPDVTYYFFILIDISSDVVYGTTFDVRLTIKNQSGLGTEDGWFNIYNDDVRTTTFTVVTILPSVRESVPVPAGLKIVSSNNISTVSWTVDKVEDLSGFLIYKGYSIEELCKIKDSEYILFTSSLYFVDQNSSQKVYYKIKSVDKYFNLSEDSMFISTTGELFSVYYENNKIRCLLTTSQENKSLYSYGNSFNEDLHIKILKNPITDSSTEISKFELCIYRKGVLSNKISNLYQFDYLLPELRIYFDETEITEKLGSSSDVQKRLSIFWYDGISWNNIGGGINPNFVSQKVKFNGNYKLAVTPVIKDTELLSITPQKFFSPFEQPPYNTVKFLLKHKNNEKSVGKIFDLAGKEVKTLTPNVLQQDNVYTFTEFLWDGKDDKNNPVRSGVYIYQFESGNTVINGTIILVK
jgi:hypothetical protein